MKPALRNSHQNRAKVEENFNHIFKRIKYIANYKCWPQSQLIVLQNVSVLRLLSYGLTQVAVHKSQSHNDNVCHCQLSNCQHTQLSAEEATAPVCYSLQNISAT